MAALSALLPACSPLGILDSLLASEAGFTAERAVAYGDGPRRKLDAYVPQGTEATAPEGGPLVVFFYGGGWRGGTRVNYRFVGQALARCGLVTVIPDYRTYPEVRFPAFVEDAARAVRWARDNAARLGADPGRIVLAGHSAGAHTAAMLALDPRYLGAVGLGPADIEAVVGIAGPYGFDPLKYDSTRSIFRSAADIDDARPLALAKAGRTPGVALPRFALLHGRADETVIPRNSIELARTLEARGADAALTLYDGIGHYRVVLAFFDLFNRWAPVRDDLVAAATGKACAGTT